MLGSARRLWFTLLLAPLAGACSTEEPVEAPDAGVIEVDVGPRFSPIQITDRDPPPNLFSVWGSGPSDVYAVGEGGLILHFDGAQWTEESSTSAADLRAVWGHRVGQTRHVYAVGRGGTVLHLSVDLEDPAAPRDWVVEASGTDADLNAVSGSRDRVFAVGLGGAVVERTEQDGWTAMNSRTVERLNGVWMSGDGAQAVAVGNLGTIMRWEDGDRWRRQRVAGLTTALQKVWGRNAGRLYIVGLDGTVLRWRDDEWQPIEGAPRVNLRDIYGISGNEAFIVGWSGVVLRTNGQETQIVPDASVYRLESVWGTQVQVDAGAEVDAEPVTFPRYYIVGASGTVLEGP